MRYIKREEKRREEKRGIVDEFKSEVERFAS
jgi:hypothetical protein